MSLHSDRGQPSTSPSTTRPPARDHLWLHFTRHSTYENGGEMPLIVRGEGHKIWDSHGQRVHRRAGRPVRRPGRPRPRGAGRGGREAGQGAGVLPALVLRAPARRRARRPPRRDGAPATSTASSSPPAAARPSSPRGSWPSSTSSSPASPTSTRSSRRAVAYHGTPQGALSITGIPPLKEMFEPLVPGAHKVPNTNFYRAPGVPRRRREGLRPLGRGPHRRGDRVRGPRHRRRRLPRAGAERRRLLPAAARLLRAGPRDLRRVRRPARLRRGHLRLRPARGDVRRDRVRLPARHHHLRQGHDLGLLADRRDDRQRPALRAVQDGHDGLRPRLHLRRPPGLLGGGDGQPRHLRARGPHRPRPAERAGVPGDPGEAPRHPDRRRRARPRLLLRHRAGQGPARPRRRSTTPSPSGCCAATSPARCGRPASTAAPTTAATRSSSSPRR